jgi:heme oxygenase
MRGARHSFLREATADRHTALDAAVSAAGFFNSLPAYLLYLQRLHAFHRVFDLQARDVAPDLFARWNVDLHAGLLARDIDVLGAPASSTSATVTETFRLLDRSTLIGALYVLIGSSLGARVLLPWAKQLPLPDTGGIAYLSHLAASRDWPVFVEYLETETDLDEAATLRGAQSTFDAVHLFLVGRLSA